MSLYCDEALARNLYELEHQSGELSLPGNLERHTYPIPCDGGACRKDGMILVALLESRELMTLGYIMSISLCKTEMAHAGVPYWTKVCERSHCMILLAVLASANGKEKAPGFRSLYSP
jgi:hypothetical protein